MYAYVNSDKVHHYGNDDDYADKYAVWIAHLYSTLLKAHHTRRDPNGIFIPGVYSIAINVAMAAISRQHRMAAWTGSPSLTAWAPCIPTAAPMT